jgi:hypothetical protein
LQEGRENANIDAGLGFIWRISAEWEDSRMDFASFAHHPPRFHHWDGQWTEGGFSTYHLQAIYDFCRTRGPEAPVILETGAGNSTVCFLHLNPARMISIAPEQPLFDRVMNYCADNAINTRPLESYVEGSE